METKLEERSPTEVDFDDEDSVLAAMAEALGEPVEDLSIEVNSNLGSFRTGKFYTVSSGRTEYVVAENSDEARDLALAVVKQDLEEEPEIFNQDFIESHIDTDRLRRDLSSDVESMAYDDLHEEAERHPADFIQEHDLEWPTPTEKQVRDYVDCCADVEDEAAEVARIRALDAEDQWVEISEEPEVDDRKVQELAEKQAEERLRNPMEYLEEIYGREEAVKKAIEVAGIDVDGAAEEAVNTDGAEHFIARYDGTIHDGPGGIVYWREN